MTFSHSLRRLANKLLPGAIKVNDTSKVSNPAMKANKEVRHDVLIGDFTKLGILRNHNGDSNKNFTLKYNFALLEVFRDYSILFTLLFTL